MLVAKMIGKVLLGIFLILIGVISLVNMSGVAVSAGLLGLTYVIGIVAGILILVTVKTCICVCHEKEVTVDEVREPTVVRREPTDDVRREP